MALFGLRRTHGTTAESPAAPAAATPAGPRPVRDLVADLEDLVYLEGQLVLGRQPPRPAWEVDQVVDALAEAHYPRATDALAQALSRAVRPDAPLTTALLDALGRDGSEAALGALLDVALGRTADVAARAAAVLAEASGAFPLVVTRLQDPDPQVRRAAAALLARLGGADAVEPLVARLADDDAAVREQAAGALGDLADARAVLPLLHAEETERRTARAGHSAVTWTGHLSPYLLAAGRIVTGDPALGWTLSSALPYQAQEQLAAALAEARRDAGITEAPPAHDDWTVAALRDLLQGTGSGEEVRYHDARSFVTDRERCRHLGLALREETGESHSTVYGEQVDQVAVVTCTDGTLRLVGDQERVRALEGAP